MKNTLLVFFIAFTVVLTALLIKEKIKVKNFSEIPAYKIWSENLNDITINLGDEAIITLPSGECWVRFYKKKNKDSPEWYIIEKPNGKWENEKS